MRTPSKVATAVKERVRYVDFNCHMVRSTEIGLQSTRSMFKPTTLIPCACGVGSSVGFLYKAYIRSPARTLTPKELFSRGHTTHQQRSCLAIGPPENAFDAKKHTTPPCRQNPYPLTRKCSCFLHPATRLTTSIHWSAG